MMSCKETARIVSEMRDHHVPWRKRAAARFHLAVCKMCVAYRNQLELISRISRSAGDIVMNRPTSPTLSETAKQRIKERLSGRS